MSNKLIGSGITFPFIVNNKGGIDVATGTELIQSSIRAILYWPKNQRFFQENFGSNISKVLEEPNDIVSRALIRYHVFNSINNWDKRVTTKDVEIIEHTDKSVVIRITYIVRSTRLTETMVFPFYKEIIY